MTLSACINEYVRHRRSLGVYFHGEQVQLSAFAKWLGHVSIDTTNVYAEVDLETKAQMLAASSFGPTPTPARRWRDDPSLMQFLRSL